MTSHIAARPAIARPAHGANGLGGRFLHWILALDAAYRGARAMSRATDAQLADMGLARADVETEMVRLGVTADAPDASARTW
jgi:uncharacterized protein YjiS (DUF1127 family)